MVAGEEKRMRFHKGDRVRISQLGLTKFLYPKRLDRRGIIVGPGLEYPHTIRVKWDGFKDTDALSEEFVELISEPARSLRCAGEGRER